MPTCKDIDAQIVDWLYHELAPPAQASFCQHIDACETCAAEIASFSFIRELMRALPSEEPPLACSSIILHEAGKRGVGAPSGGERGSLGFWAFAERLMRSVMAHPAVTAVASLLLIVSIGGTLYLRGGGQLSEPVLTNGEEMHSAITEHPASAADELTGKDIGDQPLDDHALDENQNGRAADLVKAEDQDRLRKAGQISLGGTLERGHEDNTGAEGRPSDTPTTDDRQLFEYRADSDKTASRPRGETAAKAPERSRSSVQPSKKARIIKPQDAKVALGQSDETSDELAIDGADRTSGVGTSSRPGSRSGARTAMKSTPEPPISEGQPNQPQRLPDPVASESPAMDRAVRASKDGVPRNSTKASLAARYQELERALADRRCSEAARIANDILDQDRAYYSRNIRNRKRPSACSREILAETDARAKRRAAEAKRAKKVERTNADETAAEAVTAD